MAVSFPSMIASSVMNRCSLFLPIAADLVTTAVFRRMTSNGKAQVAGSFAGIGALYFLGKQTHLAISLTGAVLYLIYKVIATIHFPASLKLTTNMIVVERKWLELQKSVTYVSDEALDYADSQFDMQFTDLAQKLEPQTRPLQKQWEHRAVLIEAQRIMEQCRAILFEIHASLRQQARSLPNREARLQKMVELLKNPAHDIENKAFDRAFTLLNEVYRMVRCKGYTISLPNIRNYPDRNYSGISASQVLDPEYCELFFKGMAPQLGMNLIFNNMQDELAGLLKILYPGSPLTAKDEQHLPGDYGNPDNPFKINYA